MAHLLSNMFSLILLIKSFHIVPNLTFKNVALPIFEPKIRPKSDRSTTRKLVFGHLMVVTIF